MAERKKKDDTGRDTEETEKYLTLVAEKDDNINTLAEQTGFKIDDLKQLNLGELNEGSILTGLGELFNFDVISKALNYKENQCAGKNNCFNSSIEIAEGNEISKNGINMAFRTFFSASVTDQYLLQNFESTANPQSGNLVRFSSGDTNNDGQVNSQDIPKGEVGGALHYATFLLKNNHGIQVFSKNGIGASRYEMNYVDKPFETLDNKSIQSSYGSPVPLTGTNSAFYKRKK